MHSLALLVATAILCAAAACGTTSSEAGAPDAAPTSTPPDAAPAETGTSAADAGEDAAIDGLTCNELAAAYGEELARARACNPTSLVNECTAARERTLGCGCETFVSANGVARLDRIAAAWKAKSCQPVCTDVLCKLATSGTCNAGVKTPVCEDVFDR
jgi:hypothetical protein